MAPTTRIRGVVVLLLVAACGGSGDTAPSTSAATTTPPPVTTTTLAATTTLPPTTTTVVLDCHSYGEAMKAVAQSLLYQTFDGAAALERQQGDELAESLLAVSTAIGALSGEVESLGEPPAGYDEAIALMLEAIEMDEEGYAAASDAARAGDQAALDDAIATVDAGFLVLMDANATLATAQECSPGD